MKNTEKTMTNKMKTYVDIENMKTAAYELLLEKLSYLLEIRESMLEEIEEVNSLIEEVMEELETNGVKV